MGTIKDCPWDLNKNEKLILPWYSFILFFLDRKEYSLHKSRVNEINKQKSDEKREKFFASKPKITPCARPKTRIK